MLFAIQRHREWRGICAQVMDEPALADDRRFVTNADRLKHRDALEARIELRLRGHARATVISWLESADIPTGSVNDVAAVASHPQLAARGRWKTVGSPGGPIPALIPPHNLAGVTPRMGDVPALGAHTAEVLRELGIHDRGGEA